ncbi:hypothetical protein CEXT_35081 [Caerostris extrusa]|uniref:Uncharacterized protein n=1 Tax=Caerostris extrusa TaxID=172846 RepID=A0AAV4VQ58_CAEEX|nr:hypothetical protein CEXT_35081 [Caerostris extrusa]
MKFAATRGERGLLRVILWKSSRHDVITATVATTPDRSASTPIWPHLYSNLSLLGTACLSLENSSPGMGLSGVLLDRRQFGGQRCKKFTVGLLLLCNC